MDRKQKKEASEERHTGLNCSYWDEKDFEMIVETSRCV